MNGENLLVFIHVDTLKLSRQKEMQLANRKHFVQSATGADGFRNREDLLGKQKVEGFIPVDGLYPPNLKHH
uniref:Uncharacterized protein n=1 Tax=Parascaris equorum TaxID=6256 RepID=A0A914RS25_PAREQ